MIDHGSSSRARRGASAARVLLRMLRGALVLSALAVMTSCGDKVNPVRLPLSLDSESAAIEVGETIQLSARNASGTLSWSSSNTAVATVASTGFVTATGVGSARITARTATDSAGATITVRAPRVIALSTANLSIGAPAVTGGTVVRDINVTNGGPGTITGLNVTEIRYPAGTGTPWLTAQLLATSATTAQAAVLRLSAAVTSLAPGAYAAMVIVGSDATAIVPASVNVTFTVGDPPTIELSATSASFAATSGGADPAVQRLTVRSGTAAQASGLTTAITYNEPAQTGWLSATLDSTGTTTGLSLQAVTGTRPAGTYTASVVVAASNAAIAARTVLVSFTVGAGPNIALNATALTFSAVPAAANPAAQQVAITNGGGGTLTGLAATVQYTTGSGWLTATLNTTTAPATLTVQPATGALAAGTYTAKVLLASAGASNTPRTVDVTFSVVSQPTIALSASTATFAAGAGGANPSATTITVTSGNVATLSGLSVTVAYLTGTPGWLSATLSATTAPSTLTLQATTGALAVGTYTARASIASAVASNSPRTVDITFTVSAGPVIAITPTSLTFASLTSVSPASQTVNVTNGGGGTLSGLAAAVEYTSGSGWLTATLNTATAPATLTVQPAAGSLAAGTYTANVRLTSTVSGVAAVLVPVTYTISAGPSITVSATSRTYAAVVGSADPAAQTVSITNGGGGTLSSLSTSILYGAGASGWLTASLSATTAPSTLTLTVARGALTSGTYTATVNVASSVATNSPRTVSVTLTVTAPAISLSATTRSATIGQGNGTVTAPTIPTVAITNAGDGTLSGLTATVTYLTGPEPGWLTGATLNTTTAPATLTISMSAGTPGALRPTGTYTARIRIESNVANNSPQDVTVQMVVGLSLANSGVYAAVVAASGAGGGGCANAGCHAAGSTSPDLSSAAAFRANLLNIATVSRAMYPLATTYPVRIVAGSASTSYLTYQLSSTSGALNMPAGLTARTLVTNWINDGALP